MKGILGSLAVGILVVLTYYQVGAAESDQSTVIPPPVKTDSPCHAPDHLPPVCEYKVYLTDEQFKSIQTFHTQNVDKMENFIKTQPK